MKTSVQSSTILVSENFSKHFGTRNCKTFNSGRVMIDCIHSHINKIHELKILDTVLEEILKRNSKSLTNNPSLNLIKTNKNSSTRRNLRFLPKLTMFISPTDSVHNLSAPCSIKVSNKAWNVLKSGRPV